MRVRLVEVKAVKKRSVTMSLKYAAFTVMMPEFELQEAAKVLKELGYEGVEWRVHSIPSGENGGAIGRANKATIDMETIDKKAKDMLAISEDSGLEILGLGTYLSYKFVDDIKRCMEAAKIMDCPSIRVSTPSYDGSVNYNDLFEEAVEGFGKVEELASQYGVRANIEIHNGNMCSSASLAYRFVSHFDPDHIGVIFDPGNMVYEGYENWQLGLELLGPYLSHLHVKNAVWVEVGGHGTPKRWKTIPASMREGLVPWKYVISVLDKVGYKGWMSLEDFSSGDARSKLADDINYLKSIESELNI